MPGPIDRSRPVHASTRHGATAAPPCRGTFRLDLEQRAPAQAATPAAVKPAGPLSPGAGTVKKMVAKVLDDEKAVDRGLGAAMSGQQMSSQDLIVLQAKVIQYSQELEVASRLVEKTTSGLKQILTTQV